MIYDWNTPKPFMVETDLQGATVYFDGDTGWTDKAGAQRYANAGVAERKVAMLANHGIEAKVVYA